MELQQQQQQLISMEGIENSNFRALLTKMINVVLAILAVVLVFVSTVANLLGPFLTTRYVPLIAPLKFEEPYILGLLRLENFVIK